MKRICAACLVLALPLLSSCALVPQEEVLPQMPVIQEVAAAAPETVEVLRGDLSLEKIFSEAPEKPEEPKEETKSTKLGLLDYVRYAMLFICFSVFLYSSYTLVDSLISRAQSRSEYDQLSDSFHTESPFAALRLPAALPNAASVDLLSAYVGVQPEEYLPSVKDENAQSKIDMVNFLKNNKKYRKNFSI